MNTTIASALTALLTTAVVRAEPIVFESPETQAVLLELFTSEGCSSCPPADAWITALKDSPDLWKRVVPVVFHVDYWNGLGWPDRFASRDHTARQRRYSAAWRANSVYTPGFVLNGREWRGWFQREPLAASASPKVGKLMVRLAAAQAEVSFAPIGAHPKELRAEFVLLGGDLVSDVKRGENSGRKLRHDFTVLHFAAAPMRPDGGRFTATIPLPAKTADTPHAIAAWVIPGEAQPPIQATGGWLRKP